MHSTMSEIKTIILGILTTAIIGASLMASAQPPFGRGPGGPGGPGGGFGFDGRFAQALNLTDEQKTQIKTLREQAQTATKPYLEQLKPLHEQMQKLVEATPFDETAVRALEQQMAAAQIEIRVIHAKTQAAIYQVLTAEQKAKLAELKTKMKELHTAIGTERQPEGRRGGFSRQN